MSELTLFGMTALFLKSSSPAILLSVVASHHCFHPDLHTKAYKYPCSNLFFEGTCKTFLLYGIVYQCSNLNTSPECNLSRKCTAPGIVLKN